MLEKILENINNFKTVNTWKQKELGKRETLEKERT